MNADRRADRLGKWVNSKRAKQYVKRRLSKEGYTVIRRVGRLFIVKGPIPGFVCARYGGWAITTDTNEKLPKLLKEFEHSLHRPQYGLVNQ